MNPRARVGREAAAASTGVWMWQSDDGKAYNPFNAEYCSALEQALKSGQQFLDVPERMWKFDLKSMTQVSTKPGGTSRQIKRYQDISTAPPFNSASPSAHIPIHGQPPASGHYPDSGPLSSAAHFDIDALPFAQRMQAVLHGPLLPHVVNLGEYNYSNTTGELVRQKGFQAMTAEEVQRLALRLQSQPHVTHLNLSYHKFGPEGMLLLAGPIAMQTSLHTLDLSGT